MPSFKMKDGIFYSKRPLSRPLLWYYWIVKVLAVAS